MQCRSLHRLSLARKTFRLKSLAPGPVKGESLLKGLYAEISHIGGCVSSESTPLRAETLATD